MYLVFESFLKVTPEDLHVLKFDRAHVGNGTIRRRAWVIHGVRNGRDNFE